MNFKYEQSCCFTGHRKIAAERLETLPDALRLELSWLIAHGITDFYAGGALGFDTLAELAVLRARSQNPSVKLHLILPCPEQFKYWNQQDIEIYNCILTQADSAVYSCGYYHGGVMHLRNRQLVDSSSYCVCYYDREIANGSGGTLYTVNYARQHGVTLINLCDEPPDDNQLEFGY